MKKILSLLIFLVLFSAHLSYGKDLLLLGALMENDQMKEGVYIDIELTNKQPDPESYTLTGENFLIVKILNFTKDKLLYYNVFFNKSSFSLKNDPLGEIIELYQGIYVNNEIAILRAKAGHYIVITSVNEKNQTFVFSKNSAAAEEFMPFLKDAIIKSGIKDFWEIEDEQITESTKIEPYQSNSKNKMIYNGIIVAEDNEIYEGGFVPVFIELEKKKQSNTGTDNIIVKIKDRGTSELYYHGEFNKDSKLVVKKDYLLIKGNSGSSSLEVKNNEDWDFVIETSLMTGKILKKYIIAIEDATQEDFSSIISFFKQ